MHHVAQKIATTFLPRGPAVSLIRLLSLRQPTPAIVRIVRQCTVTIAIAALTSCLRTGTLPSSCRVAPALVATEYTRDAGRIEGTVLDREQGVPIANVHVQVLGDSVVQRTDSAGHFRFAPVGEGRHVVTTRGAAYQPTADTIQLGEGQGAYMRMRLSLRRDVLADCPLSVPH